MPNTTPDEPTAPSSPLSVSATLRAARAKTGKTLTEVAALLRIRQPYLLALEEGRNRDLPGGAYAIGFLRTYAEFLGLDGEEMVRRFRAEASDDLTPRSELVFPSPVSEGRIPGGAVLFVGLLLAGLAYGTWYMLSSRDSSVAEMVPALPDRLSSVLNRQVNVTAEPPAAAKPVTPPPPAAAIKESEMVPPAEDDDAKPAKPEETSKAEPIKPPEMAKIEPAKVEPVKPTEKAKTAEPAKPSETVKAPEPTKVEPTKVEPAKVEPIKAEPAKPSETAKAPEVAKVEAAKVETPKVEPAKPSADMGDSRVQLLAAADDCWIQVREMDGQLLMSRLLRKGDSYTVPNRPGLTLMVGNAGALDVTVDGKKAPSLGNPGQVRRDIRLDPDKLVGG
ncbi:helix-turn-helix domain-containing protein [Magnetospirillum sulfuroxidans]|uniref:helix-turn-helix domain-containing protein n=1 Tax=Magnetospirillum sulfuroxidans TaxID=611300 RepID=UPI0031FE4F3F